MPGAGNSPPASVSRPAYVVVLVALASFAALKAFSLLPRFSDDGLYAYAACRLASGVFPYRDFFFAHPPGHLIPAAALFALSGSCHPWVAKLPVLLSAIAAGILVFHLAVTLAPAGTTAVARTVGAVMAVLVLLFSQGFLLLSGYDTGVGQAVALMLLAIHLLVRGHVAWAGVAAGCAATTSLVIQPLLAVVVTSYFIAGQRAAGWRFAGAFGAAAVVLLGAGLIVGREQFVAQVFLYHVAKAAASGEARRAFEVTVFDSWPLWSTGLLGIACLVAEGREGRRLAVVLTVALVICMAAPLTRPRVFPWYFLPAMPVAGLASGVGLAALIDRLARSWPVRPEWQRLTAASLTAVIAWWLLAQAKQLVGPVLTPWRAERQTIARTVRWTDAPLIGALNSALRQLFYRGGVRADHRQQNAVTEYLWNHSRWFDCYDQLVAAVARHAQEHPGTTLWGDSLSAPLVAVEASVPITDEFIDTNPQRFDAGLARMTDVLTMLQGSPQALVLLRSDGLGINRSPELRALLAQSYRVIHAFTTRDGVQLMLWARPSPTR